MGGSRKFRQWRPVVFFSHQSISQRAVRTSLDLHFLRGSVPVFLKKHIATCDVPGDAEPLSPPLPPLDPSLGNMTITHCRPTFKLGTNLLHLSRICSVSGRRGSISSLPFCLNPPSATRSSLKMINI